MCLITEQYNDKIQGVLHCYDRVIIQGTLTGFHYPDAMSLFLRARNIRIFDYPEFAKGLKEQIRINAERIAKENGIQIQFIKKAHLRKEDIIKKVLKKRGHHPGIVHIISVMEQCPAYKPWHDKITHHTSLKYTQGKCLHYYFYFIDPVLGLCYMRVPTWCPFRLQFYFNGHSWLSSKLQKREIVHQLLDNAFVQIDDFKKAQDLADNLRIKELHRLLNTYAKQFCPVAERFSLSYHFSIMQAEYATDILFKCQNDLQNLYDHLIRTAIHTVKPDNIATFLGRKLHGNYDGEMGNNFNIRIEGSRIKHTMGSVAIKMYDKFKLILRIETTVNDVSFFKHYRLVEQRNGTLRRKFAQMKKNIYSLFDLQKLLRDANLRYLQFISRINDNSVGVDNLNKIAKSVVENGRSYKGFNFFSQDDILVLQAIARGEFNISGFQNKHLKTLLRKTTGQISRILRRLHVHGLIKKIGKTYKYYLTKLGRIVVTTGLKLKELYIIPQLCF